MYQPTNARIISVKELVRYRKRQEFMAMLKRVADRIQAERQQDMMRQLRKLATRR